MNQAQQLRTPPRRTADEEVLLRATAAEHAGEAARRGWIVVRTGR